MSKLYVSEYAFAGKGGYPVLIADESALIAEQVVSYTGTHGESAAFSAATNLIRVHTDGICCIQVAGSPTATTSMKRLVAGQTEYFFVGPGQKISAVTTT